MKHLSVKYLAGLTDGEGCIDWSVGYDKKHNKRYMRPRFRLTLSEPGFPVIDLLYNNFGGHVDHKAKSNPKWADAKTWYVTGSKAVTVLNNVKNHLIIKKEQAKLAIAWEKLLKGQHIDDDIKEVLKEEMSLMKKDPHRLSEKAVLRIQALMR